VREWPTVKAAIFERMTEADWAPLALRAEENPAGVSVVIALVSC